MSQKSCGQHVDLASNPSVRVTRCACGTVHITLAASGVTFRMNAETLKAVASGLGLAATHLDDQPASAQGSTSIN